MSEQGHDRYVAEIRGDLAFELVRDDDGTLRVVAGWFDCRSSDDQMSLMTFEHASDVELDADLTDEIRNALPGKGSVIV